ncbi:MAG: 2-oxoglutarate dehydrogenase E1 component [Prolixibacteraceae bacterium]|nr:2-oxoglutarate dehydrogenase E1 component [Prolixibacteraceae bacterium]MBN2648475.1 2-oxoglutarate dehydrogenase E1 component [Prolixibacteraceae bacterium]
MQKDSPVSNLDIEAIEALYQQFKKNPNDLDQSWVNFFQGFELAAENPQLNKKSLQCVDLDREFKIMNLIQGYRQRGHLFTRTNPVRSRRKYLPTLDIENFGLKKDDLNEVVEAGSEIGMGPATLQMIIDHLQETYCESVGVEYIYMRKPEIVSWLKNKMESSRNRQEFSPEQSLHIYDHLKQAVGFENFIHKKFVGQKRFSLEGSEAMIPALDAIIEKGVELGIAEFVIGMAHRGRLNVLANIIKKPYENIFREFFGKEYTGDISLGDVKYHLGFENEVDTDSGQKVKLSLLPNPSHLEAVAPLTVGMARSRIDSVYNGNDKKVAPIIIHGDSAIAGQGVVYEVVQMAGLTGYKTGGTVHIVINNQVGFTTNYLEARTSTYCTDVAKVTRSPVFHVNGDDVEALIYTVKLAMEFRQQFDSDVFIDVLSYRKYGHNEGDEPRFTQPLLYKQIETHPNPAEIYAQKLIEKKVTTPENIKKRVDEFDQLLENKLEESRKNDKLNITNFLVDDYKKFKNPVKADLFAPVNTGVDEKELKDIARLLFTLPPKKKFYRKALKLVETRKQMVEEGRLDWALCEILAYGSLVNNGHPVRLSGQDAQRGTFAHRHAALVEEDTGKKYYPLNNIKPDVPHVHVFNSPLSEYGVLGFEYGYAMAMPNVLTIWEAQFGDFSNVAQVIIDQYITSALEKWGLYNGLVLYLPHGYEGQGPEHSSARIERFIAQATNNNIQLMNLTTPANLFHALRRQMLWDFRIPMVIFTPKSLLRHPKVISTFDELNGRFKETIDDEKAKPEKIKTLVFTTGKIYYSLDEIRENEKRDDIALVRVEQLYPFPEKQVATYIEKYSNATRKIWAQDEPENMGAAPYVGRNYPQFNLQVVARKESASPAGGLMEQHNRRFQRIVDEIFKH